MSLVTPDIGLLFWMTLIFGIVFFVLAKFGFPMITGMVDERNQRIEDSIRKAKEAEEALEGLAASQQQMIDRAQQRQAEILREAEAMREQIVEGARNEARQESFRILEQAREKIAAETEAAMREVKGQAALLSVQMAEKILRDKLQEPGQGDALMDRLAGEASGKSPKADN